MIWIPLAIILAALVSIGDGNIQPTHWAFRCDTVVRMNLDSTMTVSVLADEDCAP